MITSIVPHAMLPKYGKSLAQLPLNKLYSPQGLKVPEGVCLGDLQKDDHVVLPSCTRSYLASFAKLRCQVSVWLREPPAIQGRFYRCMRLLARRFDHVLTYDKATLDQIPNAIFVPHGGCWIEDFRSAGMTAKTNHMSTIASPKRNATGHRLRHEMIAWATQNGHPMTVFGKQYAPLPKKRDGHESFRFSLVIENSQTSNYFTEKIIDSLVCMSLPIYWGTPDISKYFDPEGMIVCNSAEQLKAAIAAANEDLYNARKAAMTRNRAIAMQYTSEYELVFNAIKQLHQQQCPSVAFG